MQNKRRSLCDCRLFMLYTIPMQEYQPKDFSLPTIAGISDKTIETHLGLYKGYVTNLNTQYQKIKELCQQGGDTMAAVSAITRRIPFELAGVVNHEQYFGALENGPAPMSASSALGSLVQEQFGSLDGLKQGIQQTAAAMRGIGWVIIAYDSTRKALHIYWTVDHELGNVNLPAVVALDMWEHSYMLDYLPSDKGKYVEAYIEAINWQYVEQRFDTLQ